MVAILPLVHVYQVAKLTSVRFGMDRVENRCNKMHSAHPLPLSHGNTLVFALGMVYRAGWCRDSVAAASESVVLVRAHSSPAHER